MYLFNPGKHGRGGIIFTCLHIFFLSFFLLQYMKKASRITNNILIIILKWSGAGGYGWPVSPLSRHFLYFCVHTQLQYVYNRITVRLGPRNSKNKVSVHSWQIYSTSKKKQPWRTRWCRWRRHPGGWAGWRACQSTFGTRRRCRQSTARPSRFCRRRWTFPGPRRRAAASRPWSPPRRPPIALYRA